ncbi:hypothetical protein ABZ137_35060, partial [Streptomyces bobili]
MCGTADRGRGVAARAVRWTGGGTGWSTGRASAGVVPGCGAGVVPEGAAGVVPGCGAGVVPEGAAGVVPGCGAGVVPEGA